MCSDLDPRAPLFFLSYAHTGRGKRSAGPAQEPNRQVIKFFDDLSDNLSQLVSRPPGADPGFIDRSIPDGGRWSDELMHAVGTCQIFVALLSMPYLTSEWCGMEWHAFSQRTVTKLRESGSDRTTAILPVLWAPTPREIIPPVVSKVQRFTPAGLPDPNYTEHYRNEGVFGLTKTSPDAYEAIVWQLARRISDLHYSHRVEPRALQRDQLRNIFLE
ncbi:TIR-like protein FxsC [Actinomadura craniellae]|uniref:TIR-like protein FxsC n=1 Tax=Actinomadura craniellae TaxID=2231787 RepID=UPI001F42AC38|nr:TIR-like protein FxsC [Actinomadura craniellae]